MDLAGFGRRDVAVDAEVEFAHAVCFGGGGSGGV